MKNADFKYLRNNFKQTLEMLSSNISKTTFSKGVKNADFKYFKNNF